MMAFQANFQLHADETLLLLPIGIYTPCYCSPLKQQAQLTYIAISGQWCDQLESSQLEGIEILVMAPAFLSDELAVTVLAERLQKVFMDASAMPKVCAGFVDDIVVEGNGGPGTIYTMKLNPGRFRTFSLRTPVILEKKFWEVGVRSLIFILQAKLGSESWEPSLSACKMKRRLAHD